MPEINVRAGRFKVSVGLERLRRHTWPGNVRELEHWIESAVVLAPDGVLRAENFPKDDGPVVNDGSMAVGLTLAEAERRYVERTLEACGGNKAEAARRLGIGRNTLGRLIKG